MDEWNYLRQLRQQRGPRTTRGARRITRGGRRITRGCRRITRGYRTSRGVRACYIPDFLAVIAQIQPNTAPNPCFVCPTNHHEISSALWRGCVVYSVFLVPILSVVRISCFKAQNINVRLADVSFGFDVCPKFEVHGMTEIRQYPLVRRCSAESTRTQGSTNKQKKISIIPNKRQARSGSQYPASSNLENVHVSQLPTPNGDSTLPQTKVVLLFFFELASPISTSFQISNHKNSKSEPSSPDLSSSSSPLPKYPSTVACVAFCLLFAIREVSISARTFAPRVFASVEGLGQGSTP